MNKFWEWMIIKGYSCRGMPGRTLCLQGQPLVYPNEKMLVGYMLEYLKQHNFWIDYEDDPTQKQIDMNNKLFETWGQNKIYEYLESIINELDGDIATMKKLMAIELPEVKS